VVRALVVATTQKMERFHDHSRSAPWPAIFEDAQDQRRQSGTDSSFSANCQKVEKKFETAKEGTRKISTQKDSKVM